MPRITLRSYIARELYACSSSKSARKGIRGNIAEREYGPQIPHDPLLNAQLGILRLWYLPPRLPSPLWSRFNIYKPDISWRIPTWRIRAGTNGALATRDWLDSAPRFSNDVVEILSECRRDEIYKHRYRPSFCLASSDARIYIFLSLLFINFTFGNCVPLLC